MNNESYDKSIQAAFTNSNKTENQDSLGEFADENICALIIADGLGSYKYPKFSSERVVNFLLNEAKLRGTEITSDFSTLFKNAKDKLIAFSFENIKENEKGEEDLFGTTAICAIELETKVKIAYVGNGAAWHIRGNFNCFPPSYLFPWNAINLLNPHTVPEDGKEALYRLISNNEDYTECIPSVIEFEKDSEFGDIIMICTDGIFSQDQVKSGKNDKGIWVKYETAMLKLFEYLNHFFKTNQGYLKESLEQMLSLYLDELKPTLDDDATIGILITKRALNYQNQINWQKNENNSSNQIQE